MGNEISKWHQAIRERRKQKRGTQDVNSNTKKTVHENGHVTKPSPPPVSLKPLLVLPNTKVKVRALYPFPGVSDDDLPFNKGDLLEVDQSVLTGNDGWWLATHVKNGSSGYIPYNYVVKADATPQTQDWFFEFDRHDADKILLLPGNKKGTFLIRKAGDGGSYVLSVLDIDSTSDLSVKHYRIKPLDDDSGFYISPTKTFKDMFELIDYYKDKNATGLCCPLTVPCPRLRPSLQFRELEVSRDAVKLSTKLGGGCFGEVWKGKFRKVVDVAVKTLKPGTMTSEAFLEEAKIMHKLTHHRLVQLMAVVSSSEPFYIITELMPKGALLEFLRSEQGKKLKFSQLIDMNAQIAEGMAYLESKNYIHRDLRAANILVGERYDVKVADFGLARILESEIYKAELNSRFPVKWTAPEAAHFRKFSIKSDVWSFGVLMYEIITFGKVPYPGQTGQDVLKMVERGGRMNRPTGGPIEVSDSYYSMMLKCWNQKPEDRPTFETIFDYFDNYFIHVEPNYREVGD
ncbi:unnamed protein product [Candidula unifasciata]|uniref:Tyrosine-protein kinase n=1 Tax=Candidula unifasciata TaxID=100452 RepID=A0A8S3YK61_9EUPU|nr:unnamed protein product [Candidula unifasciata]